jgi:undecaprenyl-diphosphatase
MAEWLNSFFSVFDCAILTFFHQLVEGAGNILTPLMQLITLSGEEGIFLLAIAFALMLFKKTRRTGICMLGAICCGALITNITLKPLVCRARPFEASELYREFWIFAGAVKVGARSFPSGHTTSAVAAMAALFLVRGKKYLWICIPYSILMGASRLYFAVHYPSDVLAGIIVGCFSGIVAYYITKFIFAFLEKHSDSKFCHFILEFDAVELFKKDK